MNVVAVAGIIRRSVKVPRSLGPSNRAVRMPTTSPNGIVAISDEITFRTLRRSMALVSDVTIVNLELGDRGPIETK
jgi:hypothetical protein